MSERILLLIDEEIARLEQVKAILMTIDTDNLPSTASKKRGRRKGSVNAAPTPVAAKQGKPKESGTKMRKAMSVETWQRMAAAQQKRHAAKKASLKKTAAKKITPTSLAV